MYLLCFNKRNPSEKKRFMVIYQSLNSVVAKKLLKMMVVPLMELMVADNIIVEKRATQIRCMNGFQFYLKILSNVDI